MTKRVSSAEAKAKLPELIGKVAHGGERFIIERRGKPMAALVPVGEVSLEEVPSGKPEGLLALVGLWSDVPEEEIDEMVRGIYEDRDRNLGRRIDLGDDVSV